MPRLPCRSNSAHGQEGEVPSTLRPRGFGQVSTLHFRYAEAFSPLPDAYETLLLDVLLGDQTLFVRADKVWITCATCSTMRALWMMSTAANAAVVSMLYRCLISIARWRPLELPASRDCRGAYSAPVSPTSR